MNCARRTKYCLTGIILLFHAGLLFPQAWLQKPIHFSSPCITRTDLLDTLSQKLQVNFAYDASLVKPGPCRPCHYEGVPLIEVLNSMLDSLSIGYLEKGNHITLFPREKSSFLEKDSIPVFLEREGFVTDSITGQGIPFASVCLEFCRTGTITNEDGYFMLKTPMNYSGGKILISCLGYKGRSLSFFPNDSLTLRIKLVPVALRIPDVIIRPTDPASLIMAARDAVERNYLGKPIYNTAFFREVTWKDKACISISESVIQIYKSAYGDSFDNDQARLWKGRKKQDSMQMDRINYKVEGGIFNSLQLDLAKNPPSFMLPEFMSSYEYHYEGITHFNDRDVYSIHFDQKPEVNDALFRGNLFLDVQSLAIVGAEFELSPKGIRYARSLLVRKSPLKLQVRPVNASYTVHFRFTGSHWALSDVRTELDIRAKARHDLFYSVYHTVSDLVITAEDTSQVRRFKNSEAIKSTDILTSQINDYDPGFWEGFNILQPDARLEEAVEKLKLKTLPAPSTFPVRKARRRLSDVR